jgi:osmotically inducible lipoprotein OsmB
MKKLGISLWVAASIVFSAAAQPPPGSSDGAAPDQRTDEAPAPAAAQTAAQVAPAAPAGAPPADDRVPRAAGPKGRSLKAWVQANPRATRNAILGALAGAALGALAAQARGGKAWQGAAIGGVAGGIAGYALGKSQDRLAADRAQAVRLAGYDASQGYVLRLDSFQSDPATIAPGGTVTISVRYLVIGPDPREKIAVNYFRGIKYQDSYLNGTGPTSYAVPGGGGLVSATWSMSLPKEASPGSYVIEELIEDPHGRFQVTATAPLYIAAPNG